MVIINIERATHFLECKHVIGRKCFYYHMKCIPLKIMPDGRLKVMVFGDRYWKGREDKTQIRYVSDDRVIEINKLIKAK